MLAQKSWKQALVYLKVLRGDVLSRSIFPTTISCMCAEKARNSTLFNGAYIAHLRG